MAKAPAQKTGGFEESPQAEFTGAPLSGSISDWAEQIAREAERQPKAKAAKKIPERSSAPTKTARGTSMGGAASAKERAAAGLNPVAGLDISLEDVSSLDNSGVTATVAALSALIESGNPLHKNGELWVPHRPARPDKSEGGLAIKMVSDFEPAGDQPTAIKRPRRRRQRQRTHAGPARRHRLRQNLHHGQGDRGNAAPGAHPRAQQDARRAALFRVQEILPRQRRRVFRLLLRLLPARSLRPAHRHLHREGILDQRADRPHAPLGHAFAARARRRHHRRLGLLHLRYRLGRDLHRHDLPDARSATGSTSALCSPTSSPSNTSARTSTSCAAPSACAATPSRSSRPTWRIRPGASRCSATRSRRITEFDPLTGQKTGDLKSVKIYANSHYVTPRPTLNQAHQVDQGGAEAPPRRTGKGRPPARSPAARTAHPLRSRNAGGHRLLRRHRELFALPHRPPPRRPAADPVRIHPRQRARLRRRKPRHHPADRRHVSRRLPPQGDAGRIRLPPALLHGQPPAALRGMGRHAPAVRRRVRHARRLGDGSRPAASSPSRSSARPGSSTRRSRSARPRPRSTTSSAKSARPRARATAPSSPCSPSAWPRT